ncbi:hypothetical protein F4677DRAFT_5496 [Hypoxylon crocopeplum]|nr:hypothetical protein F4677DRAFT_5496 [Hypoxylon crocopeplum]
MGPPIHINSWISSRLFLVSSLFSLQFQTLSTSYCHQHAQYATTRLRFTFNCTLQMSFISTLFNMLVKMFHRLPRFNPSRPTGIGSPGCAP